MTDVDRRATRNVAVGAHTVVQAGVINGDVHIHSCDHVVAPRSEHASDRHDQLPASNALLAQVIAGQLRDLANTRGKLEGAIQLGEQDIRFGNELSIYGQDLNAYRQELEELIQEQVRFARHWTI